jgi:hypothetical protein
LKARASLLKKTHAALPPPPPRPAAAATAFPCGKFNLV